MTFSGLVEVHRESLESKSFTPVASGTAVEGRFRLEVDSGPGLFRLTAGAEQEAFVASDGQELCVTGAKQPGGLSFDGGSDQALYQRYESFRKASLARLVEPVRAAASRAQGAGDVPAIKRLKDEDVAAYNAHRRELNDFSLATLGDSAALYAASLRWDGDHRLDELAEIVDTYTKRHPGTEIGRQMAERVERFRAVVVGAVAPPLSGPSPEGNTIDLEEFRGRFVLVDFWASWCPPCRLENRHYVEVYGRYPAEKFSILAVSVDDNERALKAAIARDRARWRHIADLEGWKTPLAARYNVTALPANFLLDPNGRIVAKNVFGAVLDRVLEEKIGAEDEKSAQLNARSSTW